MDLNRVALFVRVVEAGGFTAAAAALSLPKSSVSRSVALLERELNVRLLQRTTRQISLTHQGRVFFEAVRPAVTALEEADALARESETALRGVVRVSIPPDHGPIAAALTAFIREHPGIRIEAAVASRYVDLVAEGFDLAVRAGKLSDSSLVARKVCITELCVVGAPAYLRRRGRPRAIGALPDHDWVLYRTRPSHEALTLTGPGGTRKVAVTAALVADDIFFCRAAVEAGAGLALLPLLSAATALESGALEVVLPEWRAVGAPLWVVVPSARFLPARVSLLRDFLIAQLGREFATLVPAPARRRR